MASKGVNKVILVGNIGQDPDVRFTPEGNAIARLSLATSETWKDRNSGQQQEKTEWHRIVVFGKLAEIVQQYVRKGSKLYVEGKLQTRKWQADDGSDRYTTEIVIDGFTGQLQMLDGRNENQGYAGGQQQPQQSQQQGQSQQRSQGQGYQQQGQQQGRQQQPQRMPAQPQQGGGFDDFDDDIPFNSAACSLP